MKQFFRIKPFAGAVRRTLPVFLSGWMAFGLTACIAEEVPSHTGGITQNQIAFGLDGTVSRALPTAGVKKIGVFGYSHTGAFNAASPSLIPDYFLNRAVIDPAGTGHWSYTGVAKYWPSENVNLSFFAYAPYIDVEDTFVLSPQAISEVGVPSIKYTTPTDITKQIDLLWSNALNQIRSTNGGVVDFTMMHALTKLNFFVKLAKTEVGRPFTVEIQELSLTGLAGTGTFRLDTGLWSLDYTSGMPDYTLTPGMGLAAVTLDAANSAATTQYTTLLAGGHCFMLIPQSLKNSYATPSVVIKYKYTNVYSGETLDGEAVLPLWIENSLEEWTAGQGINYCLNISLLEGTDIEFDIEGMISGDPWEDVNSGNPIQGGVN